LAAGPKSKMEYLKNYSIQEGMKGETERQRTNGISTKTFKPNHAVMLNVHDSTERKKNCQHKPHLCCFQEKCFKYRYTDKLKDTM
jgi:hypothetical protein